MFAGSAYVNITNTYSSAITCTVWGGEDIGYGPCVLFNGSKSIAVGATASQVEIDCIADTNFVGGSVNMFVTCSDPSTGLSTISNITATNCIDNT